MAKETLVLLPGVLSDKRVWSHQASHLADLVDCQIIPLTTNNTMQDLAQTVLEQIKGNFYLAGHSMGGWLALELARMVPERILKLCLLNTSAEPDSTEKRQNRIEMMDSVAKGGFRAIAQDIAQRYVYNRMVKEEVFSMFLRVGEQAFLNQEQILLTRQESQSFLSQLSIPTLIIHAKQDQVFSLAVHQELVDKIPNAKLAIIEDCGHMSPIESPQTITAFLRFWLSYF